MKTYEFLNKKFEGATVFVQDPPRNYHKTINKEKELEKILELVEEINQLEYDKDKHPFLEMQVKEINEIANMDRLDLKTGLVITKIIELFKYMEKHDLE